MIIPLKKSKAEVVFASFKADDIDWFDHYAVVGQNGLKKYEGK
jgi:hypothetical protein